ncbi:hypothetical protein HD554DRAFT_2039181 [Boletus coccyginus]|nr:hypothetical protein HD554DRAFT_2039181 [Boletus coccyginus]
MTGRFLSFPKRQLAAKYDLKVVCSNAGRTERLVPKQAEARGPTGVRNPSLGRVAAEATAAVFMHRELHPNDVSTRHVKTQDTVSITNPMGHTHDAPHMYLPRAAEKPARRRRGRIHAVVKSGREAGLETTNASDCGILSRSRRFRIGTAGLRVWLAVLCTWQEDVFQLWISCMQSPWRKISSFGTTLGKHRSIESSAKQSAYEKRAEHTGNTSDNHASGSQTSIARCCTRTQPGVLASRRERFMNIQWEHQKAKRGGMQGPKQGVDKCPGRVVPWANGQWGKHASIETKRRLVYKRGTESNSTFQNPMFREERFLKNGDAGVGNRAPMQNPENAANSKRRPSNTYRSVRPDSHKRGGGVGGPRNTRKPANHGETESRVDPTHEDTRLLATPYGSVPDPDSHRYRANVSHPTLLKSPRTAGTGSGGRTQDATNHLGGWTAFRWSNGRTTIVSVEYGSNISLHGLSAVLWMTFENRRGTPAAVVGHRMLFIWCGGSGMSMEQRTGG